jgi:hypothetical protein
MNLVSFFSDLFHPKPKGKMRVPPKKAETTQEAAARALHQFFNRNQRK